MNRCTPPLSRREVLCRIGGGFGALALSSVMAEAGMLSASPPVAGSNPLAPRPPHFAARAKRLIFLFMNGGPSHVDTFDPKPVIRRFARQPVPESILGGTARGPNRPLMASPFRFRAHGQSGIEVSEIFPEIGSCIDDICVLRSVWTDNPNHEPGLLMMNSGNMQPIRPSMGSWLTYALGSENQNLPGYIVLCPGRPVVGPQLWSNSFLPGIYQGTHINNSAIDPRTIIRDVNNRYLSSSAQRTQLDLLQEMNHLHLEQRGHDEQMEGRIASLEMAYRMQGEAQDAFDLNRESLPVRQMYGDGQFANACLLARRLAERGVRVIQIYYGNGQPWDDHGDITNHRNHARQTDKPIAALLRDLKARGLLDDTLVLWGGEFGRTPTSEGQRGRDHHSTGFSMWLAGGGVRGGMVYGSTDDFGVHAAQNRMHVHDLHATLLHLMGLDHERLTYRYSGRDFRLTDVAGQVHRGIFA
jgi:hypothetical protein